MSIKSISHDLINDGLKRHKQTDVSLNDFFIIQQPDS